VDFRSHPYHKENKQLVKILDITLPNFGAASQAEEKSDFFRRKWKFTSGLALRML
jgi:hypothetical protein